MDSNIINLERAIASIKADISILENAVQILKQNEGSIETRIKDSQSDIMQMKMNLTTDFNKVNYDFELLQRDVFTLTNDVESLTACTHAIEEKVDSISNNGLLSFTSELGVKKVITIIVLVLSIITSPSLVSNWLLNTPEGPSELKLDKLIELLEDDEKLSP